MDERRTIHLSLNVYNDLEKMRRGVSWEVFFRDLMNSVESLNQKHSAVDRELRELHEERKGLEHARKDLMKRFEEEKSGYTLELEVKINRMEQEVSHLREILKLRGD